MRLDDCYKHGFCIEACIDFCGVPDENVPTLETIYLCGDPTIFHTKIVNRAHIAKG